MVEQTAEQIIEQTYKVDPSISLSIRNPDGAVRIYGSPGPELKLKAVKRARSADQLNSIAVGVTIRPDSISIETKLSPQKPSLAFVRAETVDYTLIVPDGVRIARLDLDNGDVVIEGMRGDDARVSLVNGQLTAHNCFGNVHLVVGNGALNIIYDWWEQRNFSVNAQITVGNAQVQMPRGASFHIAAQTKNGLIASDFSESVELGGRTVGKIERSVGNGIRAEFGIRATEGNIKIASAAP